MIAIRRESADALDELSVLARQSFPPAYGEGWNRQQLAGMIALPSVLVYGARTEGLLAGFAITRQVCDESELLLIAVDPQRRRSGIGAQLMQYLTCEARTASISKLFLEMREGNDARHLYGQFGFTEVGRRLAYYNGIDGQRYDALTLACSLK